MNVQDLENIVETVVRKVMREELRDILTEAVEIASRPDMPTLREQSNTTVLNTSIADLIEETAKDMTRDDYKNMVGDTKVNLSRTNVSDTSGLPSFASKAKAILDASYQKDSERNAL